MNQLINYIISNYAYISKQLLKTQNTLLMLSVSIRDTKQHDLCV